MCPVVASSQLLPNGCHSLEAEGEEGGPALQSKLLPRSMDIRALPGAFPGVFVLGEDC